MRKVLSILVVSLLALAACSSRNSTTTNRSYDVSSVKKVDEIANLLPDAIKAKGKLIIGASTDYAPAEFLAEDLKTPIGYNIDLGKALGKVLGVKTEVVNAEFASLLPAIGTRYNIGISSFTITPERLKSVNMVSYIVVGSSFGVAKGNPKKFSANDLCGKTIGVQTGSWQHEEATGFVKKCAEQGKPALNLTPYAKQSAVTTNLVSGKLDAMYADSTITQYAITLTNGQIEETGLRDSSPQGVVISKTDPQLTSAIQKALQHLMDDGTWKKIAVNWGVEKAILTKAVLNPET